MWLTVEVNYFWIVVVLNLLVYDCRPSVWHITSYYVPSAGLLNCENCASYARAHVCVCVFIYTYNIYIYIQIVE